MSSPERGQGPLGRPPSVQLSAGSPLVSSSDLALLQSELNITQKEMVGLCRDQLLNRPYSFNTDTSLSDSQELRYMVTRASQSLPSIQYLSSELRLLEGSALFSPSSIVVSPPDPAPVKEEPPDEALVEEEIDVCHVSPEPPPKRQKLVLQTPAQVAPSPTHLSTPGLSIKPRSQRKRPPVILSSTPKPRSQLSSLETGPPPKREVKNEPVSSIVVSLTLPPVPSPAAPPAVPLAASLAVPLAAPPTALQVSQDWPLRVVLLPQEKSSKNLDYVGGVKENVNAEYFVFCRDHYTIPFNIYLGSACKATAAMLRVKVLSHSHPDKPVTRCPNHRHTFRYSTPIEQFLLTATDTSIPLPPERGSGFVVYPVPEVVKIAFYCRNSCDIKHNRRLRLSFAICDKNDRSIAEKSMELKVCQVPLRDIHKEGVKFHVVPSGGGKFILAPLPQYDTRSSIAIKQEVKEEILEQPTTSSVRVIYVNGDEAYSRVMAAAKAEEDRVRLQPEMSQVVPHMNAWTRETPIEELLLVTCGMIDSKMLGEIFRTNGISTLGALSKQFDVQLGRLPLPPDVASRIASVFLNWFNTLIFNELNAAPRAVA